MAEGIFAALAEDQGLDVTSESAGVRALKGEPAAPHASAVIEEMGMEIRGHRARQVSREMLQRADLTLTMTPLHRDLLVREFDTSKEEIYTLPEFTRNDPITGIADPYGHAITAYRVTARELLRYIELVLARLKKEMQSEAG
ncbi:hypothetical protein BH23ACT11_BH23ACT11_01540 [soil metagenome]